MSNALTIAKAGSSAPGGLAPAGTVLPFAGSAAPTGWLLCFGQTVSRTTYSDLFSTIGTTYGAGDGSTTFAVPDLRGRIPAGEDDMGGTAAGRLTSGGSGVNGAQLGATGGAETHTLNSAQIPAHTHTGTTSTDPGHTHSGIVTGTGSLANVATTGASQAGAVNNAGSTATGGSHSHTLTINANTGGDGAHNNTQPTIVLNYIIKV